MSAAVDERAQPWLRRLGAVERRLRWHGVNDAPAGLTAPDSSSGEQWDAGQVWAHLTEFCQYWVAQARIVLAASAEDTPEFGRTKADPVRVATVAERRGLGPRQALPAVLEGTAEVRGLLLEIDADGWERRGLHPTLGEMSIDAILEEFLVGHLEQHLDQLDSLSGVMGAGLGD